MFKKYFLLNAKNQNLGKIATQIISLLKFYDNFSSIINFRINSNIIVINLNMIKIDKTKTISKFHYKHSGYPGGLKKIHILNMLKKKKILYYFKNILRNMLPRENALYRKQLKNLHFYFDSNHPHRFVNIDHLNIIK